MTTLPLRAPVAMRPTQPRSPARPVASHVAGPQWMTAGIRRNLSARALRLMRSGD